MFRINLCILLFMVLSTAPSQAIHQPNGFLTLKKVLSITKAHQLDIRIYKEEIENAKGASLIQKGEFDPHLTSYLEKDFRKNKIYGNNTSVYGELMLSKKLRSGQTIGTGFVLTDSDDGKWEKSGTADVFLEFIQPLLKGATSTTAKERASKLIIEAEKNSYEHNIREHFLDATHSYLDYLSKIKKRKFKKKFIEELLKLKKKNIRNEDIFYIKAKLATRNTEIKTAEIQERESMQELFNHMGLSIRLIKGRLADEPLGYSENILTKIDIREKIEEYKKMAVLHRYDLSSMKNKIKASDILISAEKKNLIPTLDIGARLGYGSNKLKEYSNDIRYDHEDNIAGPNYQLKLMFDYPFGNHAVKGNIKSELAFKNQLDAQFKRAIFRIYTRIEILMNNIDLCVSKLSYIEKSINSYNKSFNKGKREITELIDIQEELIEKEDEKVDNILDLNKAIAELKFQIGGLIGEDSKEINLKNGLYLP